MLILPPAQPMFSTWRRRGGVSPREDYPPGDGDRLDRVA
jgi:hypothetical protein